MQTLQIEKPGSLFLNLKYTIGESMLFLELYIRRKQSFMPLKQLFKC